MLQTLSDLRREVERDTGRRLQIEKDISTIKNSVSASKRNLRHHELALVTLQTTAQETQQQLEFHISEVVSLALKAVFDDPYEFQIEFTVQRNKTEANLWFVRNGERVHPLSASGGGAVDVASFALRVVLWSLSKNTSATLILDEPFKHLSSDLQARASDMMIMLSEKMSLQIIIVSHVDDFEDKADKVFRTALRKGKTLVTA